MVDNAALACGFKSGEFDHEILIGNDIRVLHKRQNLTVFKKSILAVFSGVINDQVAFDQAWKYGIGSRLVYGFGMVRVHQ